MMLTHNIIIRVAVTLHVVFVLLWVTLPIELMRLIGSTFMTSLALLAASAWLPDAWQQIKVGRVDTDRITLIAIAITSLGIAGFGVYSLVFNLLGRPPSMSQLPVWVWLQLIVAFGQFLLTADPVKPKVQFHSWNLWLIASAASVLVLVGVLIGAGLQASDVIDDPFRYW